MRAGARLNCSGRAITNVLFVACVRGDEPLAEYILEEGEGAESLVNWASNEHKSTPLMGACFAGKVGLVKKLLERGASPSEVRDSPFLLWFLLLWVLFSFIQVGACSSQVRKDKVDAMLLAVSHASDEVCFSSFCFASCFLRQEHVWL